MAGVPHDEDEHEKQKAQQVEEEAAESGLHQPDEGEQNAKKKEDEAARTTAQIKKRKLYRHVSGTEAPWFPHDNDMELMKELCWEAGGPRWVFHGTPAGGAGVHGCLEAGCSVVLLCSDEHHRTHLQKFLLERSVEAMATGNSLVFKDEALKARSVHLNLAPPPKAPAAQGEKEEAAKTGEAKRASPKRARTKRRRARRPRRSLTVLAVLTVPAPRSHRRKPNISFVSSRLPCSR